jgi:hypothetical protein
VLLVVMEVVELGAVIIRDKRVAKSLRPLSNVYSDERWAPTLCAAEWLAAAGGLADGEYFVCLYDGWREYSLYVPPSKRRAVPWRSLSKEQRRGFAGRGVAGEPRFVHHPGAPAVYPTLCCPVLAYARHRGDDTVILLPDPEFVASAGYAPFLAQVAEAALPLGPPSSQRLREAPAAATAAAATAAPLLTGSLASLEGAPSEAVRPKRFAAKEPEGAPSEAARPKRFEAKEPGAPPSPPPLFWRGSANVDPMTLGINRMGHRNWIVRVADAETAQRQVVSAQRAEAAAEAAGTATALREPKEGARVLDAAFVPHRGPKVSIAQQLAASPLQLDLDGMVGAWSGRFWKLFSRATVPLRPHTPWEQWYEAQMLPWVHYVPILEQGEREAMEQGKAAEQNAGGSKQTPSADFYRDYEFRLPSWSALVAARAWCLANPERCDKIAAAGSALASKILRNHAPLFQAMEEYRRDQQRLDEQAKKGYERGGRVPRG